jgi:hypothetical protein
VIWFGLFISLVLTVDGIYGLELFHFHLYTILPTLEIPSSHLNDHVRLQKHGNKREPHGEFPNLPNPPMPVATRPRIHPITLNNPPVSDIPFTEFKEARRIWRQERKSRRLRENALQAGHPHPIPPPSPVSQSTPEPNDPAPSVPLPPASTAPATSFSRPPRLLVCPLQSPLWSATIAPGRPSFKSRIHDRHHPYTVPPSEDTEDAARHVSCRPSSERGGLVKTVASPLLGADMQFAPYHGPDDCHSLRTPLLACSPPTPRTFKMSNKGLAPGDNPSHSEDISGLHPSSSSSRRLIAGGSSSMRLPSIKELRLDLGVEEYERFQQTQVTHSQDSPRPHHPNALHSSQHASTTHNPQPYAAYPSHSGNPVSPRSGHPTDYDYARSPLSYASASPLAYSNSSQSPKNSRAPHNRYPMAANPSAASPSQGQPYTYSQPPHSASSSTSPAAPHEYSVASSRSRGYSAGARPAASQGSHPTGHRGPRIDEPDLVFLPASTESDVEPRRRKRRRWDEIDRKYACNFEGCTRAYGSLSHLNDHVSLQNHGPKRRASGKRVFLLSEGTILVVSTARLRNQLFP